MDFIREWNVHLSRTARNETQIQIILWRGTNTLAVKVEAASFALLLFTMAGDKLLSFDLI